MNKILAVIIFFSSHVSAQEIQSYVVNSCGESVNRTGISFRTSIGEPIVGTHRSTNASLQQGFLHNNKKTINPITTSGATGLYPNPTNDIIFIKPNIPGAYQVKLINAMGQTLATVRIVNNSINLRSIPSGFYVAIFLDAAGQFLENSKIIKR